MQEEEVGAQFNEEVCASLKPKKLLRPHDVSSTLMDLLGGYEPGLFQLCCGEADLVELCQAESRL